MLLSPIWLAIAGGAVLLVFGSSWVAQRSRVRARIERARRDWGGPLARGGPDPRRELREKVDAADASDERLDDQTWTDLGLDDVVAKVDRTWTGVGSQTLYRWVRRPLRSVAALEDRDAMIRAFAEEPRLRERVCVSLLELGPGRGNYLANLLWGKIPEPALPLWLLRAMPIALLGSLTAGILFSSLPLLVGGAAVFITNVAIHHHESRRIAALLLAMQDLGRLVSIAGALAEVAAGAGQRSVAALGAGLREARAGTKSLTRRTAILHMQDPLELSEYLKTVLLLQVIRFYGAASLLRERQGELRAIFDAVGELDVLQAAASVRTDGDTCVPQFTALDAETTPRVGGDDLRHPLLEDPVGNDIELPGTSLLLTGSNMAGKTTMLRTVAVNAVLAQSLLVVFGDKYRASPVWVTSCIAVSDDLMAGRSYYRAELEAILRVVRQAEHGGMLVVLDEIFRGTNPIERTAAATAVLRHLARRNIVIAATHDVEIADHLGERFAEAYFSEVEDAEGGLDFDYRLRPGRLQHPNALALLGRVGFPSDLVDDALSLARSHTTPSDGVVRGRMGPAKARQ